MKNSTKRLILSSAVLVTTISMMLTNNNGLNSEEIYLKTSGLLAWAEAMGLATFLNTENNDLELIKIK